MINTESILFQHLFYTELRRADITTVSIIALTWPGIKPEPTALEAPTLHTELCGLVNDH